MQASHRQGSYLADLLSTQNNFHAIDCIQNRDIRYSAGKWAGKAAFQRQAAHALEAVAAAIRGVCAYACSVETTAVAKFLQSFAIEVDPLHNDRSWLGCWPAI
jgi:hypothetical protein